MVEATSIAESINWAQTGRTYLASLTGSIVSAMVGLNQPKLFDVPVLDMQVTRLFSQVMAVTLISDKGWQRADISSSDYP